MSGMRLEQGAMGGAMGARLLPFTAIPVIVPFKRKAVNQLDTAGG